MTKPECLKKSEARMTRLFDERLLLLGEAAVSPPGPC